MNRTRTIWMFLFLVFSSCASEPHAPVQKLPSGEEIKIISVGKTHFTQGDPALTLQYETATDIENLPALRHEAERIWPTFRVNAEKSGLTHAVIAATEARKGPWSFFSPARSHNFLVTQEVNGTWRHHSWGRDYDAEAKPLAVSYLDSIKGGDFVAAARSFHHPESMTGEELAGEVRGISRILRIVADEMGAITSYEPNKREFAHLSFFLQSGSQDYWNKHPFFTHLVFDVKYAKKGDGYLIVRYSIINGPLVIHSVLYGLAADDPDSKATFKRIHTRVMRELSPRATSPKRRDSGEPSA